LIARNNQIAQPLTAELILCRLLPADLLIPPSDFSLPAIRGIIHLLTLGSGFTMRLTLGLCLIGLCAGWISVTEAAPPRGLASDESTAESRAEERMLLTMYGSTWNDTLLIPGQAGYVWFLGRPVRDGNRVRLPWYLSDETKLPRVGFWEINGLDLTFVASTGKVLARAKLDPENHTITGHFVRPETGTEFGRIELQRESQRKYRIMTREKALQPIVK